MPSAAPCKEEAYARQQKRNLFPPESPPKQRIALQQIWNVLREENRQQTLRVLSRIVAQQLHVPPNVEEERHEDC